MSVLERLTAAIADRYRVTRELGAGGMATVYLAHDVKHDRDVAIKVLHPDLGAALGGERFLSEIRTTARLQHPHILPLLDSGDADGLLYYVMPLVVGETLRARLERERQLPLDAALRIATEVADALAYAHRQGVIHRDIKPENILLHDGRPVVADFGIALAVQTAGGARMTQTGLSLGTPQYMSPEQAMGERTIDARSDIYALGAVTYEMLTGEPPFTGATVQAIVAKVLTERPSNPTAVRDTIPRHVEVTVLRALAKIPADRWATATEFAHALQHPEATAFLSAALPATAGASRGVRGGLASRVVPWGVAALAMGVAAWAWMGRRAPSEPMEPPLLTEAIGVNLPQSALAAGVSSFVVSRDGTHLAWLAPDSTNVTRIVLATLGGGAARAIPGTEGAASLTLSPDAKSVLFSRGGELQIVSVDGGQPRRLLSGASPTGLTWSSAGWLVIARPGSVSRVRVTGGEPEVMLADSSAVFGAMHEIEETGTLIMARTRDGVTELVATSIDGGPVTPLGIQASRAAHARGVLVFVGVDGILQGVPFDPRRLKSTGDAMPLGDTPISASNQFDLSAAGVLVFAAPGSTVGDLMLLDRSGRGRAVADRRAYRFPRFAPSGSRVAVGVLGSTGRTREGDLWSVDVATGVPLRITTDGVSTRPVWAPDGQSLVFSRQNPKGRLIAARVSVDGTTPFTALVERSEEIFEVVLSADGRTLVWRQDTPGTGTLRDIFAAPVDSPSAARPVVATRFNERGIAVGPERDWLAYVSNESGRDEVYIRRLAPGSPRWPVSRNGGVEPRWTRSGEVFFRHRDSVFVSRVVLGASPGDAPQIAEPTPLFAGEY